MSIKNKSKIVKKKDNNLRVDLNYLESFNSNNMFTYAMGLKLETSTYIGGSEASGICFNVSGEVTVATEVVTESSVRFQIYLKNISSK